MVEILTNQIILGKVKHSRRKNPDLKPLIEVKKSKKAVSKTKVTSTKKKAAKSKKAVGLEFNGFEGPQNKISIPKKPVISQFYPDTTIEEIIRNATPEPVFESDEVRVPITCIETEPDSELDFDPEPELIAEPAFATPNPEPIHTPYMPEIQEAAPEIEPVQENFTRNEGLIRRIFTVIRRFFGPFAVRKGKVL